MNQSDFDQLLETGSRRALTACEQQRLNGWLTAHPEGREAWAEASALRKLLNALPEAPLSPRFTARVLTEVERLEAASPRRGFPSLARWRSRLWGWRGAAVGVAALVMAIGVSRHQEARERARLAESVAAMSALVELPDLEALAEFELVYHLPTGPLPDERELAKAFE